MNDEKSELRARIANLRADFSPHKYAGMHRLIEILDELARRLEALETKSSVDAARADAATARPSRRKTKGPEHHAPSLAPMTVRKTDPTHA